LLNSGATPRLRPTPCLAATVTLPAKTVKQRCMFSCVMPLPPPRAVGTDAGGKTRVTYNAPHPHSGGTRALRPVPPSGGYAIRPVPPAESNRPGGKRARTPSRSRCRLRQAFDCPLDRLSVRARPPPHRPPPTPAIPGSTQPHPLRYGPTKKPRPAEMLPRTPAAGQRTPGHRATRTHHEAAAPTRPPGESCRLTGARHMRQADRAPAARCPAPPTRTRRHRAVRIEGTWIRNRHPGAAAIGTVILVDPSRLTLQPPPHTADATPFSHPPSQPQTVPREV